MQEIAVALYVLSVVASYPDERKPTLLNATLSVFLKVLVVLVFILGVLGSIVSLSGSELREWLGVIGIVVVLTGIEAAIGGVDAIVARWIDAGGKSSPTSRSPDTDDTDVDPNPIDQGLSGQTSPERDPKRRTAETDLDRIRKHLDEIDRDSGGRSPERIAERLNDRFTDVRRVTDELIVINGDVIIDNHEEHEQTEVTRIDDETTIDDSVINRSDIETDPTVDRDDG